MLDQFAVRHGFGGPNISRLHVALEEHLTNVISYGYDPGQAGTICLRFSLEPSWLKIEIEDDARAFNPLEMSDVDTTLPLEAKPLGGLGLHMIRKSVDNAAYCRRANRNLLTIAKRLN